MAMKRHRFVAMALVVIGETSLLAYAAFAEAKNGSIRYVIWTVVVFLIVAVINALTIRRLRRR